MSLCKWNRKMKKYNAFILILHIWMVAIDGQTLLLRIENVAKWSQFRVREIITMNIEQLHTNQSIWIHLLTLIFDNGSTLDIGISIRMKQLEFFVWLFVILHDINCRQRTQFSFYTFHHSLFLWPRSIQLNEMKSFSFQSRVIQSLINRIYLNVAIDNSRKWYPTKNCEHVTRFALIHILGETKRDFAAIAEPRIWLNNIFLSFK